MRHFERIRKYPHHFDPGFGSVIEWKSVDVVSLVYMILDGDYYINADMENIIPLMAEWYS